MTVSRQEDTADGPKRIGRAKGIPAAALWLRAARAQFLQASLLPVGVGSALAYRDGLFSWGWFWAAAASVGMIQIGTNLANDYFDHRSGADERNRHPTPFSGGSRVIQEGLLSPGAIFRGAMIAYALGAVIGLALAARAGWGLIGFGLAGVVLSYFYTAPPLKLGYRGFGEVLVGILLGPLAVGGAYYLFAGRVGLQALAASLPIGFLVAEILFINQVPDAESDAASGKRHWVVRAGRGRAARGYFMIAAGAYASLLAAVLSGLLPAWTLLGMAPLPLVASAGRILIRNNTRQDDLIRAMGMTIVAHLLTGLLMILGLAMEGTRVR